MPTSNSKRAALAALTLSVLLAGCGGGADTVTATSSSDEGRVQALKKGNDCSGSCTGGGGTPVIGVNPLPTAAPAAGILVRESFGPGPAGIRAKGGKGDLRSTFIGTTLGGFWVEWPGNKDNAWITNSGEASWKFTAGSNGGPNPNGNELPSPLEVDTGFGLVAGQAFSDVSDGTTGGYPTALLPVAWPATAWSVSIEGVLWGNTPASYIALGLTDSGSTLSNLTTSSTVTLLMRPTNDGLSLVWELWQAGTTRMMLATGPVEDLSFNQLKLSYDPLTQQLSVHVNGAPGGVFPMNLGKPRYAAFEEHGLVDNFLVQQLGTGVN